MTCVFSKGREMKEAFRIALICVVLTVTATAAQAEMLVVTVRGEVEFNQIGSPPLGNANPGDAVTVTFLLDSNSFVDSPNFPTRGYVIDQGSFSVALGSSSVIGLQDPFPGGQTPYFVIRDNDPAVDGFLLSTDFRFPVGVPLDQVGVFGNFIQDFSVTYTGDTLASLDILDAVGAYDFTNLTVFGFNIEDGAFKPLGIVFEDLTIESQAIPTISEWGMIALACLLMCAGALVVRRRMTTSGAVPA